MGRIAVEAGTGAALVIHGGSVVSYCIEGELSELGR